jgi:hypothetical protein
MLTQKELTYTAWVLSFSSRLLTSPYAFKGGSLVQETRRYKVYLRFLWLGVMAFDLLITLLTLPATMATNTIIHKIAHGFYTVIRAGVLMSGMNYHVYRHEVQEFLNQTVRMNSDLGARFLQRKELPNNRRESLFFFMICITCAAIVCSQMFGLIFTFCDLPFTVYPGTENFRGNAGLFILTAIVRVGFFLEEAGMCTSVIVGIFCMNSTLFWLQKAW